MRDFVCFRGKHRAGLIDAGHVAPGHGKNWRTLTRRSKIHISSLSQRRCSGLDSFQVRNEGTKMFNQSFNRFGLLRPCLSALLPNGVGPDTVEECVQWVASLQPCISVRSRKLQFSSCRHKAIILRLSSGEIVWPLGFSPGRRQPKQTAVAGRDQWTRPRQELEPTTGIQMGTNEPQLSMHPTRFHALSSDSR